MRSLYFKVATLLLSSFALSSCAFDGEDFRILSNVGGNYYLADNPTDSNGGFMIVYPYKGDGDYEIVSYGCLAIYHDKNTILFTKKMSSESIDTEYCYINLNIDSAKAVSHRPVLMGKGSFLKQIPKLERVNIPVDTPLK